MTEDCNQDGCGHGGLAALTLSRSSVAASAKVLIRLYAETICFCLLQKFTLTGFQISTKTSLNLSYIILSSFKGLW